MLFEIRLTGLFQILHHQHIACPIRLESFMRGCLLLPLLPEYNPAPIALQTDNKIISRMENTGIAEIQQILVLHIYTQSPDAIHCQHLLQPVHIASMRMFFVQTPHIPLCIAHL